MSLLFACGGDAEAAASAHARGALGRDGFSELRLVEVADAPGTFDFTGEKEGQRCEGTVVVRGGEGARTAAISSACEPMDDAR